MRSKRVLMLVYTYVPDDPRVIGESRSLTQMGYQITAIGSAVHRSTTGHQVLDGIDITILPMILRIGQVPRAVWWLLRGHVPQNDERYSSSTSNLLSLLFFNLWILRLSLFHNYDLIHVHEHQALISGWLLALIKRINWIYDAHEYTPGNRANFKTLKARASIAIESFFLRRANAVITVGERLADALYERGASKVVIVGNWKDLNTYNSDENAHEDLIRQHELYRYKLVIAYIGGLDEARQVNELIKALSQTRDVAGLIGGRGKYAEMVAEYSKTHHNIIWLGWLPYEMVPTYTNLSAVIYACLKAVSTNPHYMAPNKLFDAFAAGKAMIAARGIGEIGQILEDEKAAILLDEVTPDTVRNALETLRDDSDLLRRLQANAKAASAKYNWGVAEDRLAALYTELIKS